MGLLLLALLLLPALVRVGIGLRARRQRADEWRGVPVVESSREFRGWKVGQLVVDAGAGTAWLTGVTGRSFGVDVVAECGRRGCSPPGLDCRCGFYAFRSRDRALGLLDRLTELHPTRGYVLLTVDLDGEVLEYERGFRAQRQRVHRIELPGRCGDCLADLVPRQAAVVVADPEQRARQALEPGRPVETRLPMGSAPVRAVCGAHASASGLQRLDVPTLRGLIRTEVDLLRVTRRAART